jgi:hypothetical protein
VLVRAEKENLSTKGFSRLLEAHQRGNLAKDFTETKRTGDCLIVLQEETKQKTV